MARHRKIDTRMWGDAKFCALSPPQPNAQTLWFYLLTGPHTTSIPGLFVAGESGLAEALKWPLKGFREAFREVLTKGMAKADFEARVVWIPNAIEYNQPESPNVVKSWRAYWDDIPECQLKVEAYQRLKGFLEGLGKGFAEGFIRTCMSSFETPSPNQEQEQEQDNTPLPPKGGFLKPSVEDVRTYCSERKNKVDAEAFIAHYESNGWRVGRTPMKNWKAAVVTWEKNDFTAGARNGTDQRNAQQDDAAEAERRREAEKRMLERRK